MNLTAQAVGLLATALGVISLQCKTPRSLLLCQMSGNVAFVVHYLMLEAYTACIGQVILIFNILVICGRNSAALRWKGWRWIFSLLTIAACAVTWQDGFSLLPCGAALVTILTNWTFEPRTIRLGKLVLSCPAWVVYDLYVGSWSGILCELIAMASALLAMVRYKKPNGKHIPLLTNTSPEIPK